MSNKVSSTTNRQADVKACNKKSKGKEDAVMQRNEKVVLEAKVGKDKMSALPESFIQMFDKNCLLCIPKNKTYGAGMVHGVSMDEVQKANQLGYDAYFIPNSGGPKVGDITRFNACYIDLDLGKTDDGKYLPIAVVKERKASQMAFVHSLKPKPTIIVETRNGYHLYWLLIDQKSNTVYDWKLAERKLLSLLKDVGADPNAVKPNQILRLPYTYWHKPWTNEPPFLVKVVESNNEYYTIDGILTMLKDIKPYTCTMSSQDGLSYKDTAKPNYVTKKESNLSKISKYMQNEGNGSIFFLGNVTINIGV